jgi:hypothetical protein
VRLGVGAAPRDHSTTTRSSASWLSEHEIECRQEVLEMIILLHSLEFAALLEAFLRGWRHRDRRVR